LRWATAPLPNAPHKLLEVAGAFRPEFSSAEVEAIGVAPTVLSQYRVALRFPNVHPASVTRKKPTGNGDFFWTVSLDATRFASNVYVLHSKLKSLQTVTSSKCLGLPQFSRLL